MAEGKKGSQRSGKWNHHKPAKGKGSALEGEKYLGLSKVIEKMIRDCVNTDYMQFGFMRGRGTTDAIFSVEDSFLFSQTLKRPLKESHV